MGRTEADIDSTTGNGGRGRLIVNTTDELVVAYRIVKSVHRSDPVMLRRVLLQL